LYLAGRGSAIAAARDAATKPFRRPPQIQSRGQTIDGRGFVSLSICECEILSNPEGRTLEAFKRKQVIRNKRRTIGKGSGERLKWSEEGARSLAASKFLS
jgi:hypothetical protein